MIALCVAISPIVGSAQTGSPGITVEEARKIVGAVLEPRGITKLPKFSIDYAPFPYAPEFYFFDAIFDNPDGSVVQGHYAVNSRTGDVWDPIDCSPLTSQSAGKMQKDIRRRFRLTKKEYLKLRDEKPAC